MGGEEGHELVTGPWEAFALAAIAPLGPFTHAHLAPKIPPALLNNALLTYLPLERNELILALIDRGGREPAVVVRLTTRRIYLGGMGRREAARTQSNRRVERITTGRSHWSPVTELCRNLFRIRGDRTDRSGSISAGGRAIVLKGIDQRLGEALARFLEKMSIADRQGTVPSVAEIDPDLAARIPRVLPAVAQFTARSRALSQDLIPFPRRPAKGDAASDRDARLHRGLRGGVCRHGRCPACPSCCPSAAALEPGEPTMDPRIVLRGEFWRLITSVFIHGGLIHLAMNMWSLFVIGPLVERLYGNMAYAIVYLAAGLGGAHCEPRSVSRTNWRRGLRARSAEYWEHSRRS